MLLGALTNYFPFVYYQLMNWIVVGAALTAAWQFYKQKNLWLTWLYAFIAVTFNPLAPLHIQQDIWRIIDIAAAIIIALALVFMKNNSKK